MSMKNIWKNFFFIQYYYASLWFLISFQSNDDNEDNAQGSHKAVLRKERRVKKRVNKYVGLKQPKEKVDNRKTKSNPGNNSVISSLEENGTKVNKVHDLADSLQNELAELVIGDRMFIDNNNKNKTQQTTAQDGDNGAQNDNKDKLVRIKGFPGFLYKDIPRCVLVEDWNQMKLKSELTPLLHVELSKFGALSEFGYVICMLLFVCKKSIVLLIEYYL